MRIGDELRAHRAAGSLAEELPYWGWLGDGRTCLTRSGELIAAGRVRPAATDGRTPEQADRVLGLWQRLLSGLGSGSRLQFHLLRRPAPMAGAEEENASRNRGRLGAEAPRVPVPARPAAQSLRDLVARPGPAFGRHAHAAGTDVPVGRIAEAPEEGSADLSRLGDRGGGGPVPRGPSRRAARSSASTRPSKCWGPPKAAGSCPN